ncbi:MAG: NFACT family protein [Oscillospiraceae bacterium]|nr:NFACT family protein [Oscillospiraceae bacterium]
MALDAAMVRVAADELDTALKGARIEKIYMPSRDEAVFSVRTRESRRMLLLSARSGTARAHITTEEFDYPAVPPAFCMLLRKYLLGARITAVETVEGDRVMLFRFEALNDMGEKTFPSLSAEMMGRYSNLVLIGDDGVILDAVKRVDSTQSELREIIPGAMFTEPPKPDKISFLCSDDREIVDAVKKSGRTVSSALLQMVSGLSPLLCREAALEVDDLTGDTLDADGEEKLLRGLARIRSAVEDPAQRSFCIVYDGEKPVEYSFLALRQYEGLKTENFDSASSMFDSYYSARDRLERMKTRSQDLNRQVRQLIDRNIRKQNARREELEDTARAEGKKLFGELLTANLHAFKKGDKEVTVLNYYTGEQCTIPLDVTKGPNENAQKYYRDYRKLHTAADVLKRLIVEGDEEAEYFRQVQYEIGLASTEEEFVDIRKELRDAGYLKGFRYRERGHRKSDPYFRYRTDEGLEVIAGKNNTANERLSLKMADGKDYWFHVKGAAGSHVILRCDGIAPSERSLTQACEIAAFHSSVSSGQQIPVDYTEARRVRKAAGARMGMVTYTNQKTAFVTPVPDEIEKLREKRTR